ncbi:hypothetical protein BDW75DRAFT_189955 [Aspergillus navahoensis]
MHDNISYMGSRLDMHDKLDESAAKTPFSHPASNNHHLCPRYRPVSNIPIRYDWLFITNFGHLQARTRHEVPGYPPPLWSHSAIAKYPGTGTSLLRYISDRHFQVLGPEVSPHHAHGRSVLNPCLNQFLPMLHEVGCIGFRPQQTLVSLSLSRYINRQVAMEQTSWPRHHPNMRHPVPIR